MALIRRPSQMRSHLTSLLLACFCLQGCLLSWGGKNAGGLKPQPPGGYYTFDHPTASSRLHLDSMYTLKWRTSDTAGNGPVRISLFRDDALLGDLYTYLLDSGSAVWDLAASRSLGDYRLGSGSGYRLRIMNETDTTKGSFGPLFSVYSDYSGSLELTAPLQGDRALQDSTLHVAWSRSGNVGNLVGLQLYLGTTLVNTFTTSASASEDGFTWFAPPEEFPTGNDYRIRIFAMSDPSIAQMGPTFSISSTPRSGTYEILLPRSGDIWVAGNYARVDWSVTGDPGPTTVMSLWRDTPREYVMAWTAVDTYHPPDQLNVPTNLASGTYRIRVASLSDSTLFAYSAPFVIQGVDSIE